MSGPTRGGPSRTGGARRGPGHSAVLPSARGAGRGSAAAASGSPHLRSPRRRGAFPAPPGPEATVHLVRKPGFPSGPPGLTLPQPCLRSAATVTVILTFQTTALLPRWLPLSHLLMTSAFRAGLESRGGTVCWLRRGAAVGAVQPRLSGQHHPGGPAALRQGGHGEGGHLTRTTELSPVMPVLSVQVLCPYLQFVGIPETWQRCPPPGWVEGCDPGGRPGPFLVKGRV